MKCAKCRGFFPDTSRLVAHHKIELTAANVTNPAIALNPANIEIVCYDCHNAEHKRFGYGKREVFIVYGSPLSGKFSFVAQTAGRGDLILDMDRLYSAVSNTALYDKPDNLRFNVFALRDKMIDMIRTRYGQWHDAYIIGGYPRKAERERLAMELGAELIYIESAKEKCLAQAATMQGFARWIEKWWGEYEP
jgi:hypothetical protein